MEILEHDINMVSLTGTISKEISVNETRSGIVCANFIICNKLKIYSKKDLKVLGEKDAFDHFFRIDCYGEEVVEKVKTLDLKYGDYVFLTGEIKNRVIKRDTNIALRNPSIEKRDNIRVVSVVLKTLKLIKKYEEVQLGEDLEKLFPERKGFKSFSKSDYEEY